MASSYSSRTSIVIKVRFSYLFLLFHFYKCPVYDRLSFPVFSVILISFMLMFSLSFHIICRYRLLFDCKMIIENLHVHGRLYGVVLKLGVGFLLNQRRSLQFSKTICRFSLNNMLCRHINTILFF